VSHETEHEVLRRAAFAVMEYAYAPYSRFRVGAALLCSDGTIVTGCNVENASFPAGLCAERNALAAAVALGHREFRALVVASDADEATPPCGVCRQSLVEFAPDLEITSATRSGAHARWLLRELQPQPFTPSSMTHA
jgi:cytidine deaminase